MRSAFLVSTTRCNRHCPYCFYETGYQDRGDPGRLLPLDETLFSVLSDAGVDHLIITGGEPLLHPGLETGIRRAAAGGLSTLLLTNGDLLDLRRVSALEDAGLSALTLSLDGLWEGGEEKAPWDLVEALARREGLRPAVITPMSRRNLSSLPSIIRRMAALGLYLLIQPAFIPEGSPVFDRYSLRGMDEAERAFFLEAVHLWSERFGGRGYAELIRGFYTGDRDARPTVCSMGSSAVVVDPDGAVFPCFHRRELRAGNLLEDPKPAAVLERAFRLGEVLRDAPCFGEHCISLFSHLS